MLKLPASSGSVDQKGKWLLSLLSLPSPGLPEMQDHKLDRRFLIRLPREILVHCAGEHLRDPYFDAT